MSTDVDDAYDTLGVPRGSRFEDVHKAWRQLAKRVHPDADQFRTPTGRARAEEQIKLLNAAHDLLKKRLDYGAVAPTPPPGSVPPVPPAPSPRPPRSSRPTRPPDDVPSAPYPWFEPHIVDFGRATMADNGTEVRLDLCNRVGYIREVTLPRLSGSFWRVEAGAAGRPPVRASFRVILDMPAGAHAGFHTDVIQVLVDGQEMRVTVVVTVTASAAAPDRAVHRRWAGRRPVGGR